MQDLTFDLSKIGWDTISAISAIMIAVLGFAINKKLNQREEQSKRYELLAEYRKEIIGYSRDFFKLVAQALSLYKRSTNTCEFDQELDVISTNLSSLVDTGRFLFPNDINGDNAFGFEKGAAFAGLRRPPLDAILAAHYAVEAMKQDGKNKELNLRKALRELKKTKQPLTKPVEENDPEYLIKQSRRCFLNVVIPDTFPREWLEMFTDLLGPIVKNENHQG